MKKLTVRLLPWLPLPIVLILLLIFLANVQQGFNSFLKGRETPATLLDSFIRLMCIYSIVAGNPWVLRNKGFYRIVFVTSIVSSMALATEIIYSNRPGMSMGWATAMVILSSMIPLNVFCQRKIAMRQAQLDSEEIPST